MNVSDIRSLYAYNAWANRRMFSVLERLGEGQFSAALPSSFPSIRESVFHIFFAEWLWLRRWKGVSPRASVPDPDASLKTWTSLRPGGIPAAQELSSIAALRTFAEAIEQERQQFLQGLSEEVLHAELKFSDMAGNPYSVPLVQSMQHVVNHGTYHRGQVTTLLRQSGAETIALDMIFFFYEEQEKPAVAGVGRRD